MFSSVPAATRAALFSSGLALSLCSFSAFAADASVADEDVLYETQYSGLAMGTLISARVIAADAATAEKLEAGLADRIEDYETLFTVHRTGPLAEVNRRAGLWTEVDCRIAELAEKAKGVARDSDRAFEPTIGTLVNVWKIGFGGDRVPERKAIDEALRHVDYTQIETRNENGRCSMRIGKGQSIDLGAIAKGWIGTAIVEDLRRGGAQAAVVDLGGNVALLGSAPSGRAWKIGVQRPDQERGEIFAVVEARGESVITSGAYERKIETNGKSYGHILSAVTGMPVQTDIASVTIVDADGAEADGWCTALFAMGMEKAVAKVAQRRDMKVLLLDKSLKTVWVSRALADRIEIRDPQVVLKVID